MADPHALHAPAVVGEFKGWFANLFNWKARAVYSAFHGQLRGNSRGSDSSPRAIWLPGLASMNRMDGELSGAALTIAGSAHDSSDLKVRFKV